MFMVCGEYCVFIGGFNVMFVWKHALRSVSQPSTAPRSLPRLLPHFSLLRADYVERATIVTRKPHAKLSVDAESWRVRRVFVYMGGGTVI